MNNFEPLFVIGNPRSGTSLYRLILTSHSDICVPPECGFIQWWYEKYKTWNLSNTNNDSEVQLFVEDLKTSKKIETWNLNYEELRFNISGNSRIESYADLCLFVIESYARQQSKTPEFLGDKNNYYVKHLDLLYTIYPKAKFLFLIRDGRDVACSYLAISKKEIKSKYKPHLPTDIEEIAKEWSENNEQILKFSKRLPQGNFHILKYEDLVTGFDESLKDVCNLLELPFEQSMRQFHEYNQNKQLEPSETLEWKQKTREPIDKKNIEKYKSEMSEVQQKLFEKIAASTLEKFDYKLDYIKEGT
ncbi:sulfotransferase [Gramella lutea]|uniref:Sulfotransferase n=1 Tax=Christiangramia lutea TaxID=1607951 RepID=A0A9X2AC68_9FLAO|nr:sulfotransferase [Christiangramia lutea]MCH4823798.1 sulfotransferase [Christiangramia lutea]